MGCWCSGVGRQAHHLQIVVIPFQRVFETDPNPGQLPKEIAKIKSEYYAGTMAFGDRQYSTDERIWS